MNETIISLDMLQSTGVGALALLLGMLMTRNIKWLQKFCIPSPVSGGLVFSIATLILYKVFHIELSFDGTLKDVFMLAFFTSVGFQSNLKVLRQGGKTLVLMLVLLVGIIVLQNVMPLIITKILDVNPLIGMAAGSISMAQQAGDGEDSQRGQHLALRIPRHGDDFAQAMGASEPCPATHQHLGMSGHRDGIAHLLPSLPTPGQRL